MNNSTEDYYINKCLDAIEAKLDWGKREDWKNYDFEKLSTAIYDATNVTLSISTLKRLCGKISYTNIPALNTLNTLAKFAGYEDWRAFKQNGNSIHEPGQKIAEPVLVTSEQIIKKKTVKKRYAYWLLLLIPFALLGYSLIASKSRTRLKAIDPSLFQFSCNKVVAEGVPNSVVFKYNATAAPTDSIFIVQTWDIRRKVTVPRNKTEHSAIYYYPGFFRTKLIADSQVVKTQDLMVTSNGWLALAEDEPIPLYFKKEEYIKDDRIEIDKNILEAYNLSLHPKAPKVRFFYMKDMGELMNDNFTFETTLKNDFNTGSGACQYVEVLIQCKDDIIIIPLSAKTCIGDMFLYAAGKAVNSKEADLSKFGCDLSQWATLKVETVNKHMIFYVNGIEAYSFTFPNDPTGIVGVQYRFNGTGAVKNTRFTSGRRIYNF